jgi:S-formylglutathione hydrolase FrmB
MRRESNPAWRLLSCPSARWLLVLTCLSAPLAPAAASTIEEIAAPSPALGHPIEATIYRPDGPAPAKGWPVLYLLHGLNGNCRDWPKLGGIQKTLDELTAAHRIKPMLVVMPDAGNSWYVDSAAVGGPGNYETAILDDLPKAVEEKFDVRRERGGRAIAGLSMGGYGALRLAMLRPDRYVAAASLSGAIWRNIPQDAGGSPAGEAAKPVEPAAQADLPPGGDHFGRAFGAPFSAKRFNAANVFTLLARNVAAGAAIPALYLTVGDHDSHGLWRGSIDLFETLMADRVNVDFRVTDGDHVWSLWRQTIEDALVFVDGKFRDAQPANIAADAPAPKFATTETLLK